MQVESKWKASGKQASVEKNSVEKIKGMEKKGDEKKKASWVCPDESTWWISFIIKRCIRFFVVTSWD